mgnify:CR=1 FL=1
MPHYKITITEVSEVTKTQRGHWTVVDKRPWTAVELEDAPAFNQEAKSLKDVMGYAPDITVTQEISKDIFTQTIPEQEFYLKKVIAAINHLTIPATPSAP